MDPLGSGNRFSAEERASLPRRFATRARQNWRFLVVLGCLGIFLVLLEDVLDGDLMRIDALAYRIVVEHWRMDWLTPIMENISALATPGAIIAMLLVIVAFAPGRRPGWCCAVNIALVTLLNIGIKALVQRPRPDEAIRLVTESGFSFPSGHSMAAMAFFGLIVWLVWHYERDRRLRLLLCAAFSLLILAIGISRIYLGVHYASDVLGGFCASLIWLAFYTRLAAPLLLGPVPARNRSGSPIPAGGHSPAESGE